MPRDELADVTEPAPAPEPTLDTVTPELMVTVPPSVLEVRIALPRVLVMLCAAVTRKPSFAAAVNASTCACFGRFQSAELRQSWF